MKKLLIFSFFVVPLLLIFAAIAVIATGIEDRPLTTRFEKPDPASIAKGKEVYSEYRESLESPEQLSTLEIGETELNQMLSLAARGIGNAAFEARIKPNGLLLSATVRLPRNPLGQYFNAWLAVVPSQDGIRIEAARLGKVGIPGWLVLAGMRTGLDAFLGNNGGERSLSSIRKVAFEQDHMLVTYRPAPTLMDELKTSAKRTYRDIALGIEPEAVQAYYDVLVATSRDHAGSGDVSFAEFLGPVMLAAKQRSSSAEAKVENRAAIVALAIFFGDTRFSRAVADTQIGSSQGDTLDRDRVKLHGRHDLVQHFTVSAGLAVTTSLGVADVIGEIKEVQDSGTGGSGFSFTDIAADRAGTRFAEVATSSRTSARVQKLLSGAPYEGMFFPSIAGLPEFMTSHEFSRRFGAVGSPEYQQVVREIDHRLSGLEVFKGG